MNIHSLRLATILLTTLMSANAMSDLPPLEAIDRPVDLQRFMGDWYVIGSIPIDFCFASEAGAHNGIETYELREDSKIQTTYTFKRDGFDGEKKQFNPVAWVHNTDTNAEWRMQFVWPFRSAYLIAYLDENYEHTVIGVPNRRNVWITSRRHDINEEEYAVLLDIVTDLGYDADLVQLVPQRWA